MDGLKFILCEPDCSTAKVARRTAGTYCLPSVAICRISRASCSPEGRSAVR